MNSRATAQAALAEAEPRAFWTDRADLPPAQPSLRGTTRTALTVVGGGLTGLWAAIEAKRAHPNRDVALVEARSIPHGASARNGGIVSDSLTHGLAHGARMWPGELAALLRMGRDNLTDTVDILAEHGVDAGMRLVGKSVVAIAEHQVRELADTARLGQQWGEDVQYLPGSQMRADVASPTYLAGVRIRSGGGLVDPARLTWGLLRIANELGVAVYEHSPVTELQTQCDHVLAHTQHGRIRTDRVVLATGAYPSALRRVRAYVIPVYDHVLVTEPLTASQWETIGWRERQGITDAGNQFHYYRPTDDGRILWGGYDAIYYRRARIDQRLEQRDASHVLLAQQFFDTYPQLSGLKFTHRWAGPIDVTSRFTPAFGTAHGGRVGYALGFTGLGVGAARFGARVALDLVDKRHTERTALAMVRRKPVPFPPEPVRWPIVQLTRRALAAADGNGGARGPWLRLLDRFGIGFGS